MLIILIIQYVVDVRDRFCYWLSIKLTPHMFFILVHSRIAPPPAQVVLSVYLWTNLVNPNIEYTINTKKKKQKKKHFLQIILRWMMKVAWRNQYLIHRLFPDLEKLFISKICCTSKYFFFLFPLGYFYE